MYVHEYNVLLVLMLFRMEKKCSKWQQAVCPISGVKLVENMTDDQMTRSLQASVHIV